jgi:hypothetical protein
MQIECKHKDVNGESNSKVLELLMNQADTLNKLTTFVQQLHRDYTGL